MVGMCTNVCELLLHVYVCTSMLMCYLVMANMEGPNLKRLAVGQGGETFPM